MNLDVSLGQLLAMAIPSGVAGLIGYFLRNAFEEQKQTNAAILRKLEELHEKVSGHGIRIEVAITRIEHLETERITRIETEQGSQRQRLHDLSNEVQGLKATAAASKGRR